MRKITSLFENYTFGPIIMTYKDFYNYQNLVKTEIDKIYSEKVTIDTIVLLQNKVLIVLKDLNQLSTMLTATLIFVNG